MTPETNPETFRAWLKANGRHFWLERYTPDEVGMLARLAGFDVLLITQELSHFQDAIRGSNFDNRMRQKIDHEETTIKGVLDLKDQWRSLDLYETLGSTWDDESDVA